MAEEKTTKLSEEDLKDISGGDWNYEYYFKDEFKKALPYCSTIYNIRLNNSRNADFTPEIVGSALGHTVTLAGAIGIGIGIANAPKIVKWVKSKKPVEWVKDKINKK